ncbi:MAG: ABC-F family ATP-binding cassette domain-containing protein [Patescibacteria group bacterium]
MVKTISLKNISQSFLERIILSGASLKITEGQKLCIVGENGAGKSTLLKIIAGTLIPTSGSLEKNGHIRTHYVAQEYSKEDLAKTISEYIETNASISLTPKVYRFGKILGYNLEKSVQKHCHELSGGQQKILSLSVGLAVEPDFLLLDEPENHLDIVSRKELVKLIQGYKGGVLFVSHDRIMIDSIADKVVEVAQGKTNISEGGYQDYIDTKLSRIEGMQRVFDTERKRIRQLQSNIGILEAKAFRGKEVSAYQKTKKELDELRSKHKEEGRPEDRKTKVVLQSSSSALHGGKLLCRAENISFRYQGMKGDIINDVSLDIRKGSHIVLLGRNGSGKSTFLKCLTGVLTPKEGSVEWAQGLKTAYFDQHAEFNPNKTAFEIVCEELHVPDQKARTILGMMKFSKDKTEVATKDLSGGERMRIRFALVFGANPDFIIFDEPTNHLDEVTWEILLDACNKTTSTILLVTHDHEFIDELKSKTFWLMKGQQVKERAADLEDLIEELRS